MDKKTSNSFEVNHIDPYEDLMTNNITCNAQPSKNLAPWSSPPLPYCEGIWKILKKFPF